jgi:monoamine oxidase
MEYPVIFNFPWAMPLNVQIACCFSVYTKFLILGAGLSGLSAARHLTESGEKDFLVLEGSHRMGGRIEHATFGGYTVEIGAQWLTINDRYVN